MTKTKVTIPRELLSEIQVTLEEVNEHLDRDFDWEESEDFDVKVDKLLSKIKKCNEL